MWMRWNDYGIGLLRKRGAGQLRQAEEAFAAVERLEPGMGALNLARVYVREGRLEEAVDALGRAAAAERLSVDGHLVQRAGQSAERLHGRGDC